MPNDDATFNGKNALGQMREQVQSAHGNLMRDSRRTILPLKRQTAEIPCLRLHWTRALY